MVNLVLFILMIFSFATLSADTYAPPYCEGYMSVEEEVKVSNEGVEKLSSFFNENLEDVKDKPITSDINIVDQSCISALSLFFDIVMGNENVKYPQWLALENIRSMRCLTHKNNLNLVDVYVRPITGECSKEKDIRVFHRKNLIFTFDIKNKSFVKVLEGG